MLARIVSCVLGMLVLFGLYHWDRQMKVESAAAAPKPTPFEAACRPPSGPQDPGRGAKPTTKRAPDDRGQSGTSAIYIDDTLSMRGFADATAAALPRMLQALGAQLAPLGSKVAYFRFDRDQAALTEAEVLGIGTSGSRFFDSPHSRQPTRIDLVVKRAIEDPDSALSAVVTDLYQSQENGSAGGTEILQRRLIEALTNKKAIALVGVRAPFEGTLHDLLGKYGRTVRLPSGSSRVLYVLLIGLPDKVKTAADLLAGDLASGNLEHHVLRLTPAPDGQVPDIAIRIDPPTGNVPMAVSSSASPCPKLIIRGALVEPVTIHVATPANSGGFTLEGLKAAGARVYVPRNTAGDDGPDLSGGVDISDSLVLERRKDGTLTLFPPAGAGQPNPFLAVAPLQQTMLVKVGLEARFRFQAVSKQESDWPAGWSYANQEGEQAAVSQASSGGFFPTLGLSGLLAALRRQAEPGDSDTRPSTTSLAFLLNIESRN